LAANRGKIFNMARLKWEVRFQQELEHAEAARSEGNEGRARVCARRAAGILVDEYFRRKGVPLPTVSAYDSLKHLASMPDLPSQAKEITHHMLLKVSPDYSLPVDADLIEEARSLKRELLGDET
jgi:hypothetical protein